MAKVRKASIPSQRGQSFRARDRRGPSHQRSDTDEPVSSPKEFGGCWGLSAPRPSTFLPRLLDGHGSLPHRAYSNVNPPPPKPSVFFFSHCPDLHYNGVSLDDLSPSYAMLSNRSNLILDEQTFQGLLSAAFTIQEHNDWQKLARQTPARQTQAEPEAHPEPKADRLCQHCGAPMPAEASRCGNCGLDAFRRAESMQPNWASMWLMSQEHGLWPECPPEIGEGARKAVKPPAAKRTSQDFASNGFLASPVTKEDAKETVAHEKTNTIDDRAFHTAA